MRALILAAILIFSVGANCAGCPPTPTPIPPPTPDSGVIPSPDVPAIVVDSSTDVVLQTPCQNMCNVLLSMQCPEATKHGVPKCVETCEHVSSTGLVDLNVTCVISATSKTEVQKCGVRCN